MITVRANKNDFNFINGASKSTGRYSLSDVHLKVHKNNVMFEATNTFILVRKSFKVDNEYDNFEAIVPVQFFKTIKTLANKKTCLNIIIDTKENTISCMVSDMNIVVNMKDDRFPDADSVYPSGDPKISYIFTKSVLKNLLNSIDDDMFVRFQGNDDLTPLLVTTSNNAKFPEDESSDTHIIMLVDPGRNR